MKKVFLFLSIILGLGVVMNSCISERIDEIIPDPGTDPKPDPGIATKKTFYLRFNILGIEGVNTYAYPDLSAQTPLIRWGASENVGCFVVGDNGTPFYSNRNYNLKDDASAAGNRTALLYDTVTTAMVNASCYGYYPYQQSSSANIIEYQLNSDQSQSADKTSAEKMDNAIADNIFMVAPLTSSFELAYGTGVLEFESVVSFLRFQLRKGGSDDFLFNSQRIKSVKLYVADKKNVLTPSNNYTLAGNYRVDVSKASGVSDYGKLNYTNGVNMITATITGGNTITGSLVSSPYVWFVVSPLTIKSNECLVAVFETDFYEVVYTSDISVIEMNNVYTFDVVADESNTVSDRVITTPFLDKDASNCYIIPRAGLCQIPLKTISQQNLRGSSIDWLWASKEGGASDFNIAELIDPASIRFDNDTNPTAIQFRVGPKLGNFTKGNVILALKNASGEIVWTWHIWITDKPQDLKYEGNSTFLDRNIGALSANMVSTGIDNYGFVYQWGRKDPFFGGDGMTNETTANMLSVARNNTIVNTGASWSVNTTTETIDMATKNPMKFICNNSTSKDKPADWLSVSNSILWSATAKTDYDPCPYGYKVPSKSDLKTLHEAPQNSMWYFNYQGHRYWDYYYYQGTILTAWPAAGMRQGRTSFNGNNGAQLLYSGTDVDDGKCIYWTSSPINIGGSTLSGGSHRIYTSGSKLYSEDDYGDNADAYPVRCVKMANP